jgi:DNA repair photolyase
MTPSKKTIKATGTREWAEKNVNFITGCNHDCRYCYSKEMAIRFKRATTDSWSTENIRKDALAKTYKKVEGMLMFPSSHDITPIHLKETILILDKLLGAGNNILIVTKPHIECIKAICTKFKDNKGQILFRFTIGSVDSATLKFWEPNAPSFEERLKSLKYAYLKGFGTSVSCEPMLDTMVFSVVDAVMPYVTDTIWIGKANNLMARLKINGITDAETVTQAELLCKWQKNKKNLLFLYEKYQDNPIIKWKDSISRVLSHNSM